LRTSALLRARFVLAAAARPTGRGLGEVEGPVQAPAGFWPVHQSVDRSRRQFLADRRPAVARAGPPHRPVEDAADTARSVSAQSPPGRAGRRWGFAHRSRSSRVAGRGHSGAVEIRLTVSVREKNQPVAAVLSDQPPSHENPAASQSSSFRVGRRAGCGRAESPFGVGDEAVSPKWCNPGPRFSTRTRAVSGLSGAVIALRQVEPAAPVRKNGGGFSPARTRKKIAGGTGPLPARPGFTANEERAAPRAVRRRRATIARGGRRGSRRLRPACPGPSAACRNESFSFRDM